MHMNAPRDGARAGHLLHLTRLCASLATTMMLVSALTACWREYTPPAHVERAEVLGVWSIDRDDSSATIELFEDGTLYTSGWPPELLCVTPVNSPISNIQWGNTEDVAGTF